MPSMPPSLWKPLLFGVLLVAALPAPAAGKRVALVIANGDYQNIDDVGNALADGAAVAQRLRGAGFEVLRPVHGDRDVQADLDFKEMVRAQFALREAAQGAEMALLYYAGHGLQMDQKPYLVPVSLPKINPESLRGEEGRALLEHELRALDELIGGLDQKAKVAVAVFDACREIPQLKEASKAVFGGESAEFRGLARPKSPGLRRLVAYSASSGELAKDGQGEPHSPYTQAWLNEFDRNADKKDILAFFNDVAAQVTGDQGQNPEVISKGISSATYYLKPPVRMAEGTPDPVVAPPPPKVARTGDILRDALNGGGQGPEMVYIQGGEFLMGSPEGEAGRDKNERQHRVSVGNFYLGQKEVTVGEFRRFVAAKGHKTDAERNIGGEGCRTMDDAKGEWQWTAGTSWKKPGFEQGNDHPVVCVSWNDAAAYAKWLSDQTGEQYRLPTEAEWEYAARAGTRTGRYWGDTDKEACGYANAADETAKREFPGWTIHDCSDGHVYTALVGSFAANAWGLNDMLGNVWEWTCSAYDEAYGGKERTCSAGAEKYALRGGAWSNGPAWVRSAYRYGDPAANRYFLVGFRLARTP